MGLLVAIALAATIEVGRRPAAYIHIHDDPNREEQLVAIRDGLFVLVSLLLGLTLALPVPPYNERFWLTLVLAPITIAIVVAQVADLDSPSTGLIRLDQRAMQRIQSRVQLRAMAPSVRSGRRKRRKKSNRSTTAAN